MEAHIKPRTQQKLHRNQCNLSRIYGFRNLNKLVTWIFNYMFFTLYDVYEDYKMVVFLNFNV